MKCTINDIASVISESVPNPSESGFDIFVGLEHYDSGEVKITRYGSTQNLVTAVKVFHKGDILLARRNVYLKRAGLVDFDGVTSGDSIVLRVKDNLSGLGLSSVDIQKYLPFVLNTEEFWNYAEKYSDGTMSKRLSPKTLLQYEFEVPSDVKKKNKLLWQAFETKESYRAMIKAIDEMVKSQFISQFGNNESNPMGFIKKPISEVATLINGRAYSANELLKSGKYRVLRVGNFFSTSDYYYSDLELEPNKYCEKGDLLYAWSATFGARIWEEERVIYHYHIWKVEYDNQLLDKEFLCFLLNEMTENLKHETHGSTMMHLTKEGMERKQIIIPPIGVQKSFVLFLHQADKSKFELKQSIEKIDKVMRALMQ